jgi:hypothetical protein
MKCNLREVPPGVKLSDKADEAQALLFGHTGKRGSHDVTKHHGRPIRVLHHRCWNQSWSCTLSLLWWAW